MNQIVKSMPAQGQQAAVMNIIENLIQQKGSKE